MIAMNETFMMDLAAYRARTSGQREAVLDYDRGIRYTYQQMQERACRLANYLTGTLGLKKGDCIAFCSSNAMAFLDAFFSGFKTGIIVTTYNPKLHPRELTAMMQNEKPKVLFFEDALADKIASIVQDIPVQHYVSLFGKCDRFPTEFYDDLLASAPPVFTGQAVIDPEDIQMYLHTGGTTGTPKAAMLSYRCVFFNAVAEIINNGLHLEDVVYVLLPLFHTSGWNVLLIPLLYCGGRVILKRSFDPGQALQIIREERPTVAIAVPTVYKMLAEHPDFQKTDFSCFKWLETGGAPARKEVMEPYWKRGIKLINAYGMTEIGPNNITPSLADMTIDDIRRKWNTVGFPMYFNQVKILNDDGERVSEGEPGEIWFKGPLTFSGYLNHPKETAEAVQDGWVRTGDIVRIDEDGYYHIVGRKKNMYISGGENIFPNEIEDVIRQLPSIRDVCVFGVHDEKMDEVGKAVLVVDAENFSMEELEEYVKKHLPSIKRPRYYQIVGSLPINAAGKTDLAELRRLYSV